MYECAVLAPGTTRAGIGVVAVALIGACSSPQATAPARQTAVPATLASNDRARAESDTESRPDGTAGEPRTGRRCIVARHERLVVLELEIDGTHSRPPAPEVTRLLVDAVRRDLALVVERGGMSFDERILENCGDATPESDGACMRSVAARLGADWLLWGDLITAGDAFRVRVQLVASSHPIVRGATFSFRTADELRHGVRRAWHDLATERDP